jgi:ABC-type metal ion transport system, periplasmic component/surface antigen
MKKRILLAAAFLAAAALAGCASGTNNETTKASASADASQSDKADEKKASNEESDKKKDSNTKLEVIKIGASPTPHAKILKEAEKLLEEKGYKLEITEFSDYVQPNKAVDSEQLDANYFQHKPYLDQFNEKNGTDVVSIGAVHYEPFGIYAGKTSSLSELKSGAKVAVPNDVTNEARALLLLQDEGLIKLKDGADINATKNDIVENSKNLEIVEVDAAQTARTLSDVDIAVINGNFALDAGLKVSDALAVEKADSTAAQTYANIVAVKRGHEKDEKIQALLEVLQSDEIADYITKEFNGAVLPIN